MGLRVKSDNAIWRQTLVPTILLSKLVTALWLWVRTEGHKWCRYDSSPVTVYPCSAHSWLSVLAPGWCHPSFLLPHPGQGTVYSRQTSLCIISSLWFLVCIWRCKGHRWKRHIRSCLIHFFCPHPHALLSILGRWPRKLVAGISGFL